VEYNSIADREQKKEYRRQIANYILQQRNGRFLQLQQKDGYWTEITDTNIILEKLATSYYDLNRKLAASCNQQISTSDTNKFLDPNKRRKLDNDSFCCG
jgi:hypothetical protein